MRQAQALWAICFLIFWGGSIPQAHALEIWRGAAIQGGMVILQSDPDAIIRLNGEILPVARNGRIVIGFHRDDSASIMLTASLPNGNIKTLTLTPSKRSYKTQRIDGLPTNMVTPPQQVLERIARDRQAVIEARAIISDLDAWQGDFLWPVHGTITGIYGSRRILNGAPRAPHYGIDIAAAKGTPIIAPASGIVRLVDDLYFTGNTIIIDHGHGISSTFLHLDNIAVKENMAVAQGDVIGTVGSSGRSTGAHLDWRVNWRDKRLDPQRLAGAMPQR